MRISTEPGPKWGCFGRWLSHNGGGVLIEIFSSNDAHDVTHVSKQVITREVFLA